MLKDYLKFAWINLTHKKIRGWLTLLGILIGVSAVVSLIGLGEGLKVAVASQFGISSTEVITVQAGGLSNSGPPGSNVANPLTLKDVEDISRLSEADLTISKIIEQGVMEYKNYFRIAVATNIPSGDKRKFAYDSTDLDINIGRLLKDGDSKKVVLGNNFLENSNPLYKPLKLGDDITFKGETFEVIGFLKKKGSFITDNLLLFNDDDLRALLNDKERVDFIVVKAKSSNLMQNLKLSIEKVLRKNRNVKEGEEDFSVETPDSAMASVNQILTGVQIFIALIASISIFVGAVGIVNTMTTSVYERRKQIGIMKAIGAKNSDIFFQFFIESGFLGLIGGLIGIALGTFVAIVGVNALKNFLGADISFTFNFMFNFLVLFGTFLIGAVAGIIPAMQAAKQKPVEVLRD